MLSFLNLAFNFFLFFSLSFPSKEPQISFLTETL